MAVITGRPRVGTCGLGVGNFAGQALNGLIVWLGPVSALVCRLPQLSGIPEHHSGDLPEVITLPIGPLRDRLCNHGRVTLTDLFGIGLTLTLIGGLTLAIEYSPLSRSQFARRVIYSDAPGDTHSKRRRSSLVLSWTVLFAAHACLAIAAIWWLTTPR